MIQPPCARTYPRAAPHEQEQDGKTGGGGGGRKRNAMNEMDAGRDQTEEEVEQKK